MKIEAKLLSAVFVFACCLSAWLPLSLTIAGLNLRLNQLCLPLVLYLYSMRYLKSPAVLPVFLSGCGLAYWLALLIWSLASPVVSLTSVGHVVLVGLNLLHLMAGYMIGCHLADLQKLMRQFIFSVAALNIVLALVTVATTLGLPVPSSMLSEEAVPLLVDGDVVMGTLLRFKFGGILAGCFSAAAVCVALALLLKTRNSRDQYMLMLGIILCGSGMILGFSRQAFLSLVAGLIIILGFLVLRGGALKIMKTSAIVGASLLLVTGAVKILPGGENYLQAFNGRVAQLFESQTYTTGTASARSAMWTGMAEDIAANPWRGAGQDAYMKHFPDEGGGSHNGLLEALHAAGIVGFVPWLALHLSLLALPSWQLLRGSRDHPDTYLLLGLLASVTACMLAVLTNLMFWNATYWLLLGLLAGAVRRYSQFGRPAKVRILRRREGPCPLTKDEGQNIPPSL